MSDTAATPVARHLPLTIDPPRRDWQARWIGHPGRSLGSWHVPTGPAPMFRREFELAGAVRRATLYICGLGYHDARLNGQAVTDAVLEPTVTQYLQRVRYCRYDVTQRLRPGANAIGVVLGTGWYNCHTPEVWHFDKAPWRDVPKLICELEIELESGETTRIGSGRDWQVGEGPWRYDGLRNGETYDARLELPGWDAPGFAATDWRAAAIVPAPGGELEEQTAPPARVVQTIDSVAVTELENGGYVFDIGQNIAGWARLRVQAPAGTELTLRYSEKIHADGTLDRANIDHFIKDSEFQTDHYICRGSQDLEIWEPRFTYHGFRHVEVTGLPSGSQPCQITGCVVATDVPSLGEFSADSELLNRLQACTRWAYIGNFVGIPTDCPHREKNGWTGDAQLAIDTGLWNYGGAPAYAQWLDTMADTQRSSGQFPGIVPTAGWGYNWGSGPAWDSAYIAIPWAIYLYTGDLSVAARHYDGMCRYLDYCAAMSPDLIADFGLGDWCHHEQKRIVDRALTSTGYYYADVLTVARIAALTGRDAEAAELNALAARIRDAFQARFYQGDGLYANGEPTGLACAVYQGLCPASEVDAVVARLAAHFEARDAKADFGILGAKYIPRVLADHGQVELAYRIITQPEFPGWAKWLEQGATTLWENWDSSASQNHIMFGDISAWFYQYLAGIAPDPAAPGFAHVRLAPQPVAGLDWVRAQHDSPHGRVASAWERQPDGGLHFRFDIPTGSQATLRLPNGQTEQLGPGKHTFSTPG